MVQIDLDKTQKAFDFLAETSEGDNALRNLRDALDKLQATIKPDINRAEFLHVLRKLISQLPVSEITTRPNLTKTDELTGLLFQDDPGKVTRLSSGIATHALNRITRSGFVIKTNE